MAKTATGLVTLVLAYVLSQFYRAFLAVLTPVLSDAINAEAGDLALSSGLWFLAFAAMQIPVGWALDRFGPRWTVSLLLAVGGGGGAAVFACASAPWHLHVAMTLLGIGCSPVLMGAYYIIAREYPARAFSGLAGMVIGFGSLGNILGAAPLVELIEAVGWRSTLWLMVAVTLLVAGLVAVWLRDPERIVADGANARGSLLDILRLRALWFMLPLFTVSYAVSAAIRGLWAGPYLSQVFGADPALIGRVMLVMGLSMVVGNFLVGPASRILGGPRRATLFFTAVTLAVMSALWLWSNPGIGTVAVLLALVGVSGAAYPMVMAHGKSFLPPHLLGRGVTFLNMFSIGGVGLLQFGSMPVYRHAAATYPPAEAFAMLWLFFLIPLAIGFALYFLTPEAKND